MEDIKKTKANLEKQSQRSVKFVTDITDGMAYQKVVGKMSLIESDLNLTATFNTDGINLYSSSKIELWPIFLAINELSPSLRFARENIILAGIWQGKGKPPFHRFVGTFGKEMNKLSNNGFTVSIGSKSSIVKVSIVCATVDLPAKAELLNMMYYNGKCACITCDEKGKVSKQGRGHAMTFP